MTDLFQVLASEDAVEQERLAGTRAVIAAQSRAKDRFEKFVSAASSQEERDARISLISSDLEQMLSDVAEEYGFDGSEQLHNAATAVLGGGHPADCTCGFCENKGAFGKDKDDDGDYDGDDDDDDKKESAVKTACNCCEDCKSGKCDCDCSDCKGHGKMSKTANKYIKKRGDKWVIVQKGTGKVLSEHDSEEKANASFRAMEMHKHEGHSVYPRVTPEFPWEHVAADVETGDNYQSETLDLGANKDGVENVGSPKIDKGKSGDEAGWNLKPIDVDSQKNRLENQQADDRADYNSADFDPSSPIRDRIDADKPLQPEHNVGDKTQTWTGTEGQAAPVTSAVLAKWSVLKA